ncbi:tyrosinase family protein [Arthrobacter sp. SLBN-100]|uniref:tyrosinase family protein n=1 Tax=Arthrobacter sp. SLBN-100 TaxID=2768450 RepID=UPI003FA4A0A1
MGFRNRLESFITQRGDSRVSTTGSQLHNRVHVWVGGNMLLMTSPDDPVFFLHHCFIDKVWADWQEIQKINNPDAAPHYAPLRDGPTGHNADDDIRPVPTPSGRSWTSPRWTTPTNSRPAADLWPT